MPDDIAIPDHLRWDVSQFLEHFYDLEQNMPTRNFCFILGSGASKPSGIKTGAELAWNWMTEIYERTHEGSKPESDQALKDWATPENLHIKGFDANRFAEFYSQLYRARFGKDDEQAYNYLEKLMDNKQPSFGYSVLAQVLSATRHKVVITTNFDNLVADALSIYTNSTPLVCGHESLASFARAKTSLRRPVIAKVHGDLFLAPKNSEDDIGNMPDEWKRALSSLLREFCPVFVGYGGNDPSVMNFLASLNQGDIEGGVYWLYRGSHDDKPNCPQAAADLVQEHGGAVVSTSGFDQFMFLLHQKLGLEDLESRIEKVANERASDYGKQRQKLFDEVNQAEDGQQEDEKAALKKIADDPKTWWQWKQQADAATDDRSREEVYQKAIEAMPDSSELHRLYAQYLNLSGKDPNLALDLIDKAIVLEQADPLPDQDMISIYRGIRAQILARLGRGEEALDEIDNSINLLQQQEMPRHNDIAISRSTRAQILRELGRYDEALDEVDEILNWESIQKDPNQRGISIRQSTRAQILRNLGRYEEALAQIDASLRWEQQQDSSDQRACAIYTRVRAQILQSLARLDEALEEVEKAIAFLNMQPTLEEFQYAVCIETRAEIRRDLGDLPGAHEDADAALAWVEENQPHNTRWLDRLRELKASIPEASP